MQRSIDKSEDLKNSVLNAINPRRLKLIIMPTEKCNFRCTYCYESYEHGAMRPHVISGVKKFISSRVPHLTKFTLEWFGGEPLLASKQLLDIAEFSLRVCKDNNCQFTPGGITTNGYFLNSELMKKLTEVNQRGFQISLDGSKDDHDTTRIMQNGNGSFDKIMKNLLDLSKTDLAFHISLRLHLTPTNRISILNLCNLLASSILKDSRFSIFLKPIGDWGGKNSGQILTLDTESSNTRISEIRALLKNFGIERVTSHINNPNSGDEFGGMCYAAEANTLVIRSTGRLAKCTVGFEDPINDVGHINEDGTLSIKHETMDKWLSGLATQDASELACPYSHIKKSGNFIPIIAI